MRFQSYIAESEETDLGRVIRNFRNVIPLLTGESQNMGMRRFSEPPKDVALLFVFEEPGRWEITTSGMKWPIDILFFDKDKKLLHREERCEPGRLIIPGRDCKYIIECCS